MIQFELILKNQYPIRMIFTKQHLFLFNNIVIEIHLIIGLHKINI